jgi:hypothetical protein
MDPWCVRWRWTAVPCRGGSWTWKAGGGRLASGVQASGWLTGCWAASVERAEQEKIAVAGGWTWRLIFQAVAPLMVEGDFWIGNLGLGIRDFFFAILVAISLVFCWDPVMSLYCRINKKKIGFLFVILCWV